MPKERETRMIIRACVGCVLPTGSKLIGQGTYQVRMGESNQYYDYEIKSDFYDDFVRENQEILVLNGLLKIENIQEEPIIEPPLLPGGFRKRIYK